LSVIQPGKMRPSPRKKCFSMRCICRPRDYTGTMPFHTSSLCAREGLVGGMVTLTRRGGALAPLSGAEENGREMLRGRCVMARPVRCGLIQTHCEWSPDKYSIGDISKKMLEKHEKLIEAAAKKKTQILCLQELFNGPYFCAEQQIRWHELTEPIPDGPTTERLKKLAKKHGMVIVVPIYEREMTGFFFNTAAVIDADGKYLGKYRKHHLPQVAPGFWEKVYFTPGNTGYLVFDTKFARIGVYICYDRHFPEGARILGLNGAEIV